MNKNAFTLVELIAVIVILALITLLVVPNVRNLMDENYKKEYEEYLKLMVEYTKVEPNYQKSSYLCLSDLNMKKINDTIDCDGYVLINGKQLTPHLLCNDSEGTETFRTAGFNLPSNCS